MENSKITKEKAEELMNLSGRVRGVALQTDAEYVKEKKGEEDMAEVEKKLKEWGTPINYKNIKVTAWYPIGLRTLSLLAIKDVFNLSDKEIENMGRTAPRYSFIVKMLLKYFLTVAMTYKESPKYWVKHYTIGEIETPGYSLEKKYFLIRLKAFKIHPIFCIYLGGYFITLSQYLLKGTRNNKVKETKCMFKGDSYHEFLVTWE